MVIVLEKYNMKKLFTFGDSFTFNKTPFECEYALKYMKDGDSYWPNIISERLGFTLYNFGHGGLSNDRILDNVIEKIDLINDGDIVIIGKSFYNRFDIPATTHIIQPDIVHKFITISPESIDILIREGFTKKEAESIIYYGYHHSDDIFSKRHNLRFEFVKKYLKTQGVTNVIFWEIEDNWSNYESIKVATNNEINDLHWSFKGHLDFAEFIFNKINNTPHIVD